MTQLFLSVHWAKNWVILTYKVGSNFSTASDSTFRVKMTQFFLSVHWGKKIESFWNKKMCRILVPPVTQLLRSKWLNFDLKSWVTWVEMRQKHLNWKKIYCIGYPTGNGQSSIIAKAVNKQNTSKLLLYKLYFKMILKMFLKSFDFQCDFDFQITTSKMILIFKSPLFRWFDFDFKIINIWWFCPSLVSPS